MEKSFTEKLNARIEKSNYKDIIKDLMKVSDHDIRSWIYPEGIPKLLLGSPITFVGSYDSMRGPSKGVPITDEDTAIERLISSIENNMVFPDEFLYYHPEYKDRFGKK